MAKKNSMPDAGSLMDSAALGLWGLVMMFIGAALAVAVEILVNLFTVSHGLPVVNGTYLVLLIGASAVTAIGLAIVFLGVRGVGRHYMDTSLGRTFGIGAAILVASSFIIIPLDTFAMASAAHVTNSIFGGQLTQKITFTSFYGSIAYAAIPYIAASWVIGVIAYYLIYRSYKGIERHSGIKMFGTSANLLLIGAVIPIIGGIIAFIGMILGLVAWNRLG
ncbi:MAG: DUF996 domain-containing protein [Candidatus Marsarchaeota archaeon]|jgi:uncharacterized membrane protein|nr:DUF996 domain-containing protein [Candidatus Marsarchaeota archaeon]